MAIVVVIAALSVTAVALAAYVLFSLTRSRAVAFREGEESIRDRGAYVLPRPGAPGTFGRLTLSTERLIWSPGRILPTADFQSVELREIESCKVGEGTFPLLTKPLVVEAGGRLYSFYLEGNPSDLGIQKDWLDAILAARKASAVRRVDTLPT
jgi:hypothetical protein